MCVTQSVVRESLRERARLYKKFPESQWFEGKKNKPTLVQKTTARPGQFSTLEIKSTVPCTATQ